MNPEYTALVLEKAAPSRPIVAEEFHLLHGALGLCTELLEYNINNSRDNAVEELGDLLWYLTFLAHHLNWSPPTSPLSCTVQFAGDEFNKAAEDFISLVKKEVIYNVSQARLVMAFSVLWDAFRVLIASHRLALSYLIQENSAKLTKRYTDSFTQEESENRRDKV